MKKTEKFDINLTNFISRGHDHAVGGSASRFDVELRHMDASIYNAIANGTVKITLHMERSIPEMGIVEAIATACGKAIARSGWDEDRCIIINKYGVPTLMSYFVERGPHIFSVEELLATDWVIHEG